MPESPSEPAGQSQSIRRSATPPTKLNPIASENVMFYHPAAKIVLFAPKASVPISSSSALSDFDYPVDTIETLPWRSTTERTVATAPLRLEKVHGLTVFLKCGNVVHAIMKNSQCWCVDGVSKFVLRIRPLTYYRIELPHESEEDQRAVEDLKAALPKVLRYEVTPCPFKRGFTVELPEEATARRRKKAWQPKDRRQSTAAASSSPLESPSGASPEFNEYANANDDADENTTDDSGLISTQANDSTLETIPDIDELPPSNDTLVAPAPPAMPRRSVTESPKTFISLLAKYETTPLPEAESESAPGPDSREDANVSLSSSPESFLSADLSSTSDPISTHPTPMEFLGPAGKSDGSHALEVIEVGQDRDVSGPAKEPAVQKLEIPQGDNSPVSPSIPGALSRPLRYIVREDPHKPSLEMSSDMVMPSKPATKPTLSTDFSHMSTEFRRRAQATRQRDISPMPPPSTIYQPSPSQDTVSLLSKALIAVLVPPIHLFIVLLHIAARIVITPAVSSTLRESGLKSQPQPDNGHVTEDDFSFPLEPEASSEYEDADMSRKSDHWDLD